MTLIEIPIKGPTTHCWEREPINRECQCFLVWNHKGDHYNDEDGISWQGSDGGSASRKQK